MLELIAAAVLVHLPSAHKGISAAVLAHASRNIREGEVAGARMRAFVDRDGRVRDCVLISHVGTRKNADALCRAQEAQRMKPALDTDGSSIGGFYETVIWFFPETYEPTIELPDEPADLELYVQKWPASLPSPFVLTLGLVISDTGAVSACGPIKDSIESMVESACAAVESASFTVVRDRRGVAIRYAKSIDAKFIVSAQAAP